MSSGVYHVFGAGRADLLGRQKEIELIRRRWLTQHVSVVCPKYYGKTVLLNHLAKLAADEKKFTGVALWNVRENPPKDDIDFWRKLYRLLRQNIAVTHEYLPKDESAANAESTLDAFKLMEDARKRVLLLWDGVDELLLKGDLSENLWNQLTSLADTKSVSLILSSRRNLMDLVPTEEAKGSDFWRRFALLLPLGCFHTNELADVVKPLVAAGGQCDANALTEILGWTGGVPLLTAALCGQIASETDGKCALKRVHVDRAAEHLDGRCVEMVWRELGAELQNDFAEIARKGADDGLQCGDMDASRANELQSRGLVTQNNGKLRSAVRLLARHAVRVTNPMPELRRHFGTQEKFMSNVQALLDLRLSQVVGLDENLKYRVSQIIRELCHPDIAMEIMRGVFDQTAELVLKADFPGNSLPPAWVTEWEQQGSLNRNDPKKRNREFFEHRVPSSRANRKWLLKLLIEAKPRPRTRLRSATFRLMDQIYEAANYGEHAAEIGEKIPMSFAISACSSVVELCHHLVEDLGKDSAAYAPATK